MNPRTPLQKPAAALVCATVALCGAFRACAAQVDYCLKDELTGRSVVVTNVDLTGLVSADELDARIAALPDLQDGALAGKADLVADLHVRGMATNSYWVCEWGDRRRFVWYADVTNAPSRTVWGLEYEGLTFYRDEGTWRLHAYYGENSIYEGEVRASADAEALDFGDGFALSRVWLYEDVRLDNPVAYSNDIASVERRLEAGLSGKQDALPYPTNAIPYAAISGVPEIPVVPSGVGAFENDAGYLTARDETDPTVPGWAKEAEKPSYTAGEVGARPVDWLPTPAEIGAQPVGDYATRDELAAAATAANVAQATADIATNATARLDAALDGKADRAVVTYEPGAATNSYWVCENDGTRLEPYQDDYWFGEHSLPYAMYELSWSYSDFHGTFCWTLSHNGVEIGNRSAARDAERLQFTGGSTYPSYTLTRHWLYEQVLVTNTVVYTDVLEAALDGATAPDVDERAAAVASNAVERILAPATMTFEYASDGGAVVTNAFIAPSWATSRIALVEAEGRSGEEDAAGTAMVYSASPLRNYSFMVEELPDGAPMLVSFDHIAATHRIFASPALDAPDGEKARSSRVAGFDSAWVLTEDDVPCEVTVREPEPGVLVVRREKYASEPQDGTDENAAVRMKDLPAMVAAVVAQMMGNVYWQTDDGGRTVKAYYRDASAVSNIVAVAADAISGARGNAYLNVEDDGSVNVYRVDGGASPGGSDANVEDLPALAADAGGPAADGPAAGAEIGVVAFDADKSLAGYATADALASVAAKADAAAREAGKGNAYLVAGEDGEVSVWKKDGETGTGGE